jgi:hypothetical protein
MRFQSAWHGPKRSVEYDVSLVVLTDMLGFEELVKARSANQMSRLIRVFREVMDTRTAKQSRPGAPPEYIINFSDLTVFSTPVRRPRLRAQGTMFFQLLGLVYAQVLLVNEEGIVIRGGVTVGDVVKSHRQLFGRV